MKRNLWVLGLGIGILAGCKSFDVPDPEAQRRDSEPVFDILAVQRNEKTARIAARSQNEFGLKLLRVVAAKNPSQNTFVSPTSMWMALAMTKNGAGGASQSELTRVLELKNDQKAPILALRAVLAAQGAKINLASAIWADQKTPFAPLFTQKSAATFGARAQNLDFEAPNSVAIINNWVKKQTDGEITGLVQDLPASGAVLTNALYFHGRWQAPFQKSETQNGPFHAPGGTEKSVPLMKGEGFAALSGPGFEGAVLPYANSSCELWAILPQKGETPLGIVANLSAAKLGKIAPQGETDIQFPRFSLDWEDSLVAPLQNLGLKTIFDPKKADLRPMGLPPRSFLAEVRHKTRLEIDEQGTVAAAATEENFASADKEMKTKSLVFDRPFVLLLRETHSGAVLFAGIVNNPPTDVSNN